TGSPSDPGRREDSDRGGPTLNASMAFSRHSRPFSRRLRPSRDAVTISPESAYNRPRSPAVSAGTVSDVPGSRVAGVQEPRADVTAAGEVIPEACELDGFRSPAPRFGAGRARARGEHRSVHRAGDG